MNTKAAGICLACLALLISGTAVCLSGPSDSDQSDVTSLHGYVYDIPAQESRTVIEGVTVITWLSPEIEYETVTTDENGAFSVQYNADVKYMSFEIAEYTVKGWCSELHKYGDTGLFEIVLKDDSQISGVHELTDDSGFTAMVSRTNSVVHGNVYTVGESRLEPVKHATVHLTSLTASMTTETDDEGFFEFDCATGVSYDLHISCGGFEDKVLQNISPSDEKLTIGITQKDHAYILGLDLAHATALFGILILLLILLVFIYIARRPEKENGVYVINDLEPLKEKKKKV